MGGPRRAGAFLILNLLFAASANKTAERETVAYWYERAVQAYLDNGWQECVEFFEKATERYREYSRKLSACRLKCRDEAQLSEPLYPVDIENLLFYERTVKATLCIIKCKREHLSDEGIYNVNPDTEKLFEDRKPYEYLHICYYQIKEYQKAASALFTYLISNPNQEVLLNTLKQYSKLDGVDTKDIVNYEALDYVYLYAYGSDAYDNKGWDQVIQYMEESLEQYLQAEEECRAQCEGPLDPGWFPDFIPAISNHFTYCLKCKQKCKRKLASLNGETHEDLVGSHYHYLQYAYFKKNNILAACQAVASYLLFFPDDETMLGNLEYYRKLPKVEKKFFTPREEALKYMQRETYETRILKFINKNFQFDNTDDKDKAEKIPSPNIKIKLTERLQGPNRFAIDDVVTQRQCKSLMEVAKMFAKLGDGYYGKISPHTDMETLEGVTLGRAAFLLYSGLLNRKYLELYLSVTETAKKETEKYFQLKDLYFSYTHLVCRSAIKDAPKNRTDFSHAIHADNCNILPNGTCIKEPPSFTWRDYSSVIYLNSDFKGGEFVFSSDPEANDIQSVVEPKCGRMVSFSSGKENLHGVKAVREGTRCAIGIWFTLDEKHQEVERNVAYQILENDLINVIPGIDIAKFDFHRKQ